MTITSSPEKNLIEYRDGLAATKAWAQAHGYTGRKGGWIYRSNGTPFIQGWAGLTGALVRHGIIRDLDGLSLSTVTGSISNGRVRGNVFEGHPVLLDEAGRI